MRKNVLVLLILAIITLEVTPAYCETPAFRKFRRGLCNMATFYLEFPQQMKKEGEKGGTGQAMTVGLAKGIGMSAARALTGAYEFVTFPLPFPPGYKSILNDPEFFWTEPFSESTPLK